MFSRRKLFEGQVRLYRRALLALAWLELIGAAVPVLAGADRLVLPVVVPLVALALGLAFWSDWLGSRVVEIDEHVDVAGRPG